jgi:hypothetical protein
MKGILLHGSRSTTTIISQDKEICPICSREKLATDLQHFRRCTEGPGDISERIRRHRKELSAPPVMEYTDEGVLACWVQKKKRTPSILRFTGAYSKRWLIIDPRTKTVEYSHAIDEPRKLLCEFRVGHA